MPQTPPHRSGLAFMRLLLVLSSLSPVFVLWAVRGVDSIPDEYWIPACLVLFFVPNLVLYLVLLRAERRRQEKTVVVSDAEDQRSHLFIYLFAMLIPLYDVNLDGYRDIAAVGIAVIFVAFLFWHMGLHYVNLLLAFAGYRIFVAHVRTGFADQEYATYAIISKRLRLPLGQPITGIRLGENVLVERRQGT